MKKHTVRKYKHPRLKFVLNYREAGKRKRKFFETRKEADAEAALKDAQLKKSGTEGASISSRLREMAKKCADRLSAHSKTADATEHFTIADATEHFLAYLAATKKSRTAAELVGELLAAKQADRASVRYLSDLKHRLNRFSADFNGHVVATITSAQIDDWLRGLVISSSKSKSVNVAPVTRNNFRRVLIVAFNFAKGRGYCLANPAFTTAKAKVVDAPVRILTAKETTRLLNAATEETLPYFAIGAFAGLRSAELARLDWSNVDFESGLIEVTAKKSKTARRRFIKMQPNLVAWLAPYRLHTGSVLPINARKKLEAVRKVAKLVGESWPDNGLRHSFASYHLAAFHNLDALALKMGHTGTDMIFDHYRELVKPKAAEAYWNIKPSREADNKVVAFAENHGR
ncbi:MAG: tyrosine-type recombinase/integrase [Chthoniobacterales bacterium]